MDEQTLEILRLVADHRLSVEQGDAMLARLDAGLGVGTATVVNATGDQHDEHHPTTHSTDHGTQRDGGDADRSSITGGSQ